MTGSNILDVVILLSILLIIILGFIFFVRYLLRRRADKKRKIQEEVRKQLEVKIKQIEFERQKQAEAIRRRAEELRKQAEELKKKKEIEIREKQIRDREEWFNQLKLKEHLDFLHSKLIESIELCSDKKPCPKCNEVEVVILSISPNIRSLLVRCEHCKQEYRIKMTPENTADIKKYWNSFITERNSCQFYYGVMPKWKMNLMEDGTQNSREPIPDDVKMFVWQRDQGRCVKCGSKEKLEYDHIIPLSKGGSNTARNIQLLCENCNRSKGANLF